MLRTTRYARRSFELLAQIARSRGVTAGRPRAWSPSEPEPERRGGRGGAAGRPGESASVRELGARDLGFVELSGARIQADGRAHDGADPAEERDRRRRERDDAELAPPSRQADRLASRHRIRAPNSVATTKTGSSVGYTPEAPSARTTATPSSRHELVRRLRRCGGLASHSDSAS